MGRMRSLAMYQVDAFADHVFGGNPAAVLVLDEWLTDAMMQNIAAENNLAETAFVRASAAGWDLRWFTPLHEVDFCGHATLATAHVLATERRVQGELVFATRVGELRVSRQEGWLYARRAEPSAEARRRSSFGPERNVPKRESDPISELRKYFRRAIRRASRARVCAKPREDRYPPPARTGRDREGRPL
ncbi:MAG TPA: PhzF family phenazine biosynthesis isomerase [Beijerinckiaceae bacterium]|nr:PhzF family phenazine biosynthesis isomerase [Beijerinckiaceae bacterium]